MDLEEIKNKYRYLGKGKRLALMFFLGLLPGLYQLYDQYERLAEERENELAVKAVAERKFEEAKEKKKALPKLEERLAKTEEEMREARKKLPDEFFMDQILERTEVMSQQLGVAIKLFDPGESSLSDTAFKYLELPIKIEAEGTFGALASFFDHLAHLDLLVNVRNITMAVSTEDSDQQSSNNLTDELLKQKMTRANTKLSVHFDMVVFRSLTDSEAAAVQASTEAEKTAAAAVPGAAPAEGGPH